MRILEQSESFAGEKPDHPLLLIIGVMMFYVVMADFTLMTPAIETLYQHFSDTTSYTTVLMSVSITGIVSFPSSIVFGWFYDRVGYKVLGALGILIIGIGGVFPFFMTDATTYGHVLVSRCIVGLGLGAVNPIGSALVTRFFAGRLRILLLGIGNTVFYSAATLFAVMSGALTSIAWNYVFLGYAVVCVPLVVVLVFVSDPKTVRDVASSQDDGAKERINPLVYGYCLVFLIYATCNYAVVQLMSTMIAEYDIGSPFIAGIATSSFTLGGMFGGLVFRRVHHVVDKYMLPVLYLVAAVSAIGLFVLHSLPAILCMSVIDGCANILLLSYIQERIGAVCVPSRVATANGMLVGLMNLGSFLGAYYVTAVSVVFAGLGLLGTRLITGIIFLLTFAGTLVAAVRSPRLKDRHYPGAPTFAGADGE